MFLVTEGSVLFLFKKAQNSLSLFEVVINGKHFCGEEKHKNRKKHEKERKNLVKMTKI